jgi:DNA-binding NarL/FixJ family response regulator
MKICIVDDHQLILDGMGNALEKQYPQAEILKVQTVNQAKALLIKIMPLPMSIAASNCSNS